jgi:hypothetical protein
MCAGDLEEVEIKLGVRTQRTTPKPTSNIKANKGNKASVPIMPITSGKSSIIQSSSFLSAVVINLLDIKAVELIDEIRQIFTNKCVDLMCAGDLGQWQ